MYRSRATSPAVLRSPKEVRALSDGYDLVDPDLVYLPQWRTDDPADARDAESVWMLAGVGCKR
jgi:hypothetical protein